MTVLDTNSGYEEQPLGTVEWVETRPLEISRYCRSFPREISESDKGLHGAYTRTSSLCKGIPVIGIPHSVVLGSVLCLSIAGTPAQDNPDDIARILSQGHPDSKAIRKRRLTVANVRQLFAVDRELLRLWNDPDVERRAAELERRIDRTKSRDP